MVLDDASAQQGVEIGRISMTTNDMDRHEWRRVALSSAHAYKRRGHFERVVSVNDIRHLALHQMRGELVGTDAEGNRYYQDKRTIAGRRRKRWVMYNGVAEASRVPPDWHGWLHYTTTNAPPPPAACRASTWQKEHVPNLTGTDLAYRPPGHTLSTARNPSRPTRRGVQADGPRRKRREAWSATLSRRSSGHWFWWWPVFSSLCFRQSDRSAPRRAMRSSPSSAVIDGLKRGGDVTLSGVKVGTVTGIDLDRKTYQAVVRMSLASNSSCRPTPTPRS